MTDHNMVMSEIDISALKDTLCAQQQLLQKLYNELDAEREASATAATEALSVILRLQSEKSALKMEAEQYKRLSEEKMSHAEESLAITEDIIYQKEMELAALDCQVQAYKYKLLSMGCVVNPGLGETVKFRDNPFLKNENLVGETSFQSVGRRNSVPFVLKCKNEVDERESFCVPEMDLVSKTLEEKIGQELYEQTSDSGRRTDDSTLGGISSYWDQIRTLDVRVKEITGAKCMSSKSESRSHSSVSSRISDVNLCDLSNSVDLRKEETRSIMDESVAADYPCFPSIHDVFEVPQGDRSFDSCEKLGKDENQTSCLGIGNPESEDVVHQEAVELYASDEPDWLKKALLQSTHCEKDLHVPVDATAVECRLAVFQPRSSSRESQQIRLNQLNGTSEIIEVERPAESDNREEELKLLNEIKEQINSLHDEIRSCKVKKSSRREEPSLCALREAMLYFWL